jgi:hypothetical protein
MGATVQVTLACDGYDQLTGDPCGETCVAAAPVVGSDEDDLRVDVVGADLPRGWHAWGTSPPGDRRESGDAPRRLVCGCPRHGASSLC